MERRRTDEAQAGSARSSECLNETLFASLSHARTVLAAWREDYNHIQPHSDLGGATPAAAATQAGPGHAPARLVITAHFRHHNSQRLCQ